MYLCTYIAAHTAVVKNVIAFGFDFDFMVSCHHETGAYKTKNYNYYKKLTLGKK